MMVGMPPAFLAHQDAPGVLEFHLAAGVAAVAHLVLEALHAHGILRAVGAPARHVEAGLAATLTHARHHQMGIAHGGREKPLVAAQQVFATAPAAGHGHGHRGVGAHVRAALLLGHAHAQPHRCLAGHGHIAWIVFMAEQLALQLLPQRRFLLQQRDGGRGHGGRAQRALLDLAVQVKAGGPGAPAARAAVLEGQGDQALLPV
jgi:hypothetical protein